MTKSEILHQMNELGALAAEISVSDSRTRKADVATITEIIGLLGRRFAEARD